MTFSAMAIFHRTYLDSLFDTDIENLAAEEVRHTKELLLLPGAKLMENIIINSGLHELHECITSTNLVTIVILFLLRVMWPTTAFRSGQS